MVQVVRDSILDEQHGYKEINKQLAKQNGELKQQLSLVLKEQAQQFEEVLFLRRQIRELTHKIDNIKNIILGQDDQTKNLTSTHATIVPAIEAPPAPIMAPVGPPNDATVDDDDDDDDEEEEDDENENDHTATPVNSSPFDDSLEPATASHVSTFHHSDTIDNTPSVWHCLDSLSEPAPISSSTPIKKEQPKEPKKRASITSSDDHEPHKYNLRKRKAV